jgi:hypothetical protein
VSGTTAIGQPAAAPRARRPFGVRLYLTLGFAAVAMIAAGFSYILISGSSDDAASERAADITVGRTVRLADRIGAHPSGASLAEIESISDPGYSAWAFDDRGHLLAERSTSSSPPGAGPPPASRCSCSGRRWRPARSRGGWTDAPTARRRAVLLTA